MSEGNVPSIASQLCLQCMEIFKALLPFLLARQESQDVAKPAVRSYRQSCTSFILWVDAYDAHKGGLDEQLNASSALRRLTYRLLVGLSDLATKNLFRTLETGNHLEVQLMALREVSDKARMDILDLESNDSSTHSSNEESDEEEFSLLLSTQLSLEDTLKDFANYVKCLSDMAPLIAALTSTSAIEDKGKAPSVDHIGTLAWWNDLQQYKELIKSHYPDTPSHLLERLANANLARFQRLREAKETSLPATTKRVNRNETRTIAGKSLIDSGLGSSMDTRSIRDNTAMQYMGRYLDPDIPKLPEGARSGKPFDCLACGHSVVISIGREAEQEWKKHLFQDLRPWVCVGPTNVQCNEPFLSREGWAKHLATVHLPETTMKTYRCPFCQEQLLGSDMEKTQHLASHLEDIALAVFLSDVDEEDASNRMDRNLEKLEHERLNRWLNEGAAGDFKHPGVDESISEHHLSTLGPEQPLRYIDQEHSSSALDEVPWGSETASVMMPQRTPASVAPEMVPNESPNPQQRIACDKCDLEFSSHKARRRHLTTATAHKVGEDGVFVCKCGMTSSRKDNFTARHLDKCRREHGPFNVFTCLCGFRSESAEVLKEHFRECPLVVGRTKKRPPRAWPISRGGPVP